MMSLIGLTVVASPLLVLFFVGSSMMSEVKDTRKSPPNSESAIRGALRDAKFDVAVTPIRPQAESVSDGFHGDGCDWFACDLSQEDVRRVAAAIPPTPPATTNPYRPALGPPDLGMDHPPAWWDAASCEDLAWVPHGNWIIAISPSRGRLYLRQFRS